MSKALFACTSKVKLAPYIDRKPRECDIVETEITVCVSVDLMEARRGAVSDDNLLEGWIVINHVGPKLKRDLDDAFPGMHLIQADFGELIRKDR